MKSSLRATGMVLGLWAPALAGCNCDAALQETPKPKAILAYQDKTTPDEDHLTAGMPVTLLGQRVEVTMELRNEGKAPLEVSNVTLGSDPALCPVASSNFVISDPVAAGGSRSFELGAGSRRNLTVRFTPSTGATDCVVMKVASNDEKHGTLRALFTGRGDAPRLCTDRFVVDFGDLEAGQVKDDVVALQSCGTHPVSLTSVTTNEFFPPFAADAVTVPVTLMPQEGVTVPVHFRPVTAGVWNSASGKSGLLTFTTDNGEVYQIELVGRAHTPPSCLLEANPPAINFGVVTDMVAHTQDVVLTNRGQRACTISSADVVAPAGPFSAAFQGGFVAGGTLAPQSTATVTVTLTPPADTGVFNATLAVASDDPITPTINIPLEANLPGMQACILTVDPPSVNFGVVPLNTFRAMGITVRNAGADICFITGVSFEPGTNPQFVNTTSGFNFLAAGASRTLTVGFRPTQQGPATGRMKIRGSDQVFGGNNVDFYVQLNARTGTTGICVEPAHLDFGVVNTPTTKFFNISACGSQTVTVSALDWTQPNAQYALTAAAGTPFTLNPGEQHTVNVTYSPQGTTGSTAVITVRSDDGVNPAIPVDMTGGPEVVPPTAGRYLYYWQIPGIQGGDVMKFPLQGATVPSPFWGPRTGKACAGCHSVSPDGKYVAVLELGTMRFVETASGLELILGNQFLDPQYFAWRPAVNTTPPYQFAYGTGGVVKVAALFDGFIRDLQGANDTNFMQTMPTWSTTGKIAFVKGAPAPPNSQQGSGATGFQGPTDLMVVDENGGTATPVPGASNNNMANYYPQFSPNGQWVAFTQSASATTTISATDSQVRLVKMDLSGTVLPMTQLNGPDGATSYPTWAVDGTYLSFSSKRSGGEGDWDIYVAPVNQVTGADAPAQNVRDLNTDKFEHAAQWSP